MEESKELVFSTKHGVMFRFLTPGKNRGKYGDEKTDQKDTWILERYRPTDVNDETGPFWEYLYDFNPGELIKLIIMIGDVSGRKVVYKTNAELEAKEE